MTNAIKVLLQMTSVSLQPVPSLGNFCKKIPKQVDFCFSLPTFWRIWFLRIWFRKFATTPNFFFSNGRVCQVTPRLKGYLAYNL
jgi:hypothetical protein